MEHLDDIVKGVFLLILAIAGNFVAETLGCKTQKLLSENMFAKHFISIFILYFAIGFVNTSDPKNPIWVMQTALFIYILFILFTKMDLVFTLIVFGILAVNYILGDFINYYKSQTHESKELLSTLTNVQEYSYILMIGLIILGFSLYFRKQYRDYYKTWSTYKFLFGVNVCSSMK